MNKTKRIILAVTALLLGLVVFGAFQLWSKENKSETVVEIDAHWPKAFNTLDEMIYDSDVIIKGTVLMPRASRLVPDPDVSAKAQEYGLPNGVIFTDSAIRVDQVIKGAIKKNDVIIVVQTGGTFNKVKMVVSDNPLFEPADQVILFLKNIAGDHVHAPNETKYRLNGSPQARFKIVDGKIVPGMPGNPLADQFDSKQETALISQIIAAMR